MDGRLGYNSPVVHWCAERDEYLNIPVVDDGKGHRLGDCPYCGVMLRRSRTGGNGGRKGGEAAGSYREEQ
ncbi:MAG TPA: hypothetical protein VGM51_02785 [Armatimonadota bacterium]